MSDPTAPVEGAPTSAAPEAAPAPAADPYAPVLSRVDELANTIDSRFAAIEQRFPASEPEPEPDPWAALFGEPDQQADEFGNPVQAQPALDPAALQAAFQQAVQQANAPLQQQLADMQLQAATQQLYKDIPQLAPTPENQTVRAETHQRVVASLQGYPPEIANALAADPKYIGTIFKAAEAERLAAGQAPASETVPTLETAGGANPGGTSASPLDQAFPAQQKALAPGFY